jgi:LPS export ABC transporter protein LptC
MSIKKIDINTITRYILLGLVILATIFIIWDHSSDAPANLTLQGMAPEADTYVLNGIQSAFDQNGHLTSKISSTKLEHFPGDTPGLLTNPDIKLYNSTPNNYTPLMTWHLKSQKGSFNLSKETVTLAKQVIALHPDNKGAFLKLETNLLHFNNASHFIHTDSQVKITEPGAKIESLGMNIKLDSKIIELKSQVHGIYYPSPEHL